jgi:LmbE family N-acetylglucosaminyl deacetylase
MIELHNPGSEVFVPDGVDDLAALERCTHLAVGAHPDDIPIMAFHGIAECFGQDDRWFAGVTVTDGANGPRSRAYAEFSDAEMSSIRSGEEKRAAAVGGYGAAVLLDYSSAEVQAAEPALTDDLTSLLTVAGPEVVYTHNPADSHDTHVAVALRVIQALRQIPPESRPRALYGCEVWRDLDWLVGEDKVAFDVSGGENLSARLIAVYESQISGGKRYDGATAGRRAAHATFFDSADIDRAKALIYAMDLTPLLSQRVGVVEYVDQCVGRLRSDIRQRIERLGTGQPT